MKVLFLDVDGVLNHNKTRERCLNYIGVDKVLAQRLTKWLSDKDIKVVLSSTWRRFPEMHSHLEENGIQWVSITPYLNGLDRGLEIDAWLSANPQVTDWAILDDTADMRPHMNRLVLTNPALGVTDGNLAQVKNLLNIHD